MDARRLLAVAGDVKINVGDDGAVLELDAVVHQPLLKRQDERFVLVVFGEFQGRQVRHAVDVVDEAVQVQLHLQHRVPLLEGKHGPPVEPEVAVEEIPAEVLVDALAFELLARAQEQTDDVLLGLVVEAELLVRVCILTLVDGRSLQRVVGVVLVEPVELIQDRSAFDFQRRDGPVELPQAFVVGFELPAATDHKAFLGLVDAVQSAPGYVGLLDDGDVLTGHATVSDQECGPCERGHARAHKPCFLFVHPVGFARPSKCLVVAVAVIHYEICYLVYIYTKSKLNWDLCEIRI